ncbi:hypothetical protein MMIC_P1379 [Mariprofundus micogutta]|uniref:Uncharacterized protein n=1 Tax=Mariprofundus micogutta TaxID=1921010 RepID=A0A1L8CNE5_9PROT|nr:hypothetical protein [Mariprofundus micogutta]GAV20414.1 hypothetical protein MMIC_P1379 [Mariprofundus micogutta]
MGNTSVRLYPLISKLGIAGSCVLFTLLAVVGSLALMFTVMTLFGVQGQTGLWIKFSIFGPLLIAPPVIYLLLNMIVELNQANESLQVAQASVKELGQLVPVCSCCKKVRDDKEYWDLLEEYLMLNGEGELPHGTCPHCKEEQFKAYIQQNGNV